MPVSGFINLYKPAGITSNKALGILKHALKENNINTKVGHFGTLDPIAEGVLPVALGRATRLFSYTLDKIKRYKAEFYFGKSTDTLDITGNILHQGGRVPSEQELRLCLPALCGNIMQVPPDYSAKVINGVRAYKLARQGGANLLEAKPVTIYTIDLLERINENCYAFDIVCGGGTYIRSIARDLGEKLGTYAVMSALVRLQSGVFKAENSVSLASIEKSFNPQSDILPIETVLGDFPPFYAPARYERDILNGVRTSMDMPEKDFSLYIDDKLIGIAENCGGKLNIKTWLM